MEQVQAGETDGSLTVLTGWSVDRIARFGTGKTDRARHVFVWGGNIRGMRTGEASMGDGMECRHEPCVCNVTGDEFCSDHCRENVGHGGDTCSCGHTECEMHQEKRRMSPGPN